MELTIRLTQSSGNQVTMKDPGTNCLEYNLSTACRLTDLKSFVWEARCDGAVVLNCLQNDLDANGWLQSLMEGVSSVPHSGSDPIATALCHDKVSQLMRFFFFFLA